MTQHQATYIVVTLRKNGVSWDAMADHFQVMALGKAISTRTAQRLWDAASHFRDVESRYGLDAVWEYSKGDIAEAGV